MSNAMITPPVDDLLGYDVDGRPGHAVLIFKDAKGTEYGVQLTPKALNKTIVIAMQALSTPEIQKMLNPDLSGHPGFPKYSLSACQIHQLENQEPFLVLKLDGIVDMALPLTEQEALLLIHECNALIDHLKTRHIKKPELQ